MADSDTKGAKPDAKTTQSPKKMEEKGEKKAGETR